MTDRLERDVADVARKWVPDPRLGVCEVAVQPGALAGCTTSRDALTALRRLAAAAGLAADVRLLPDASVLDEPAAVVTAAVAPLVREPRVAADRLSEALHGETLTVLERRDAGPRVDPRGVRRAGRHRLGGGLGRPCDRALARRGAAVRGRAFPAGRRGARGTAAHRAARDR